MDHPLNQWIEETLAVQTQKPEIEFDKQGNPIKVTTIQLEKCVYLPFLASGRVFAQNLGYACWFIENHKIQQIECPFTH